MSMKSLQGRRTPGSRDECRTAPDGRRPLDQAKPTDLNLWPAFRQLWNYIHHRHHYYSAQKLILILPSHRGEKAESPRWLVIYQDGLPARKQSPIQVPGAVSINFVDQANTLTTTLCRHKYYWTYSNICGCWVQIKQSSSKAHLCVAELPSPPWKTVGLLLETRKVIRSMDYEMLRKRPNFITASGHPKKNRSQQAGILTGSRFYETLRISVRVCDDIGLYNRLIGREYCTKQGFFKGVQFNDVYLVIQIRPSVNILLSQCKNWLINRS